MINKSKVNQTKINCIHQITKKDKGNATRLYCYFRKKFIVNKNFCQKCQERETLK